MSATVEMVEIDFEKIFDPDDFCHIGDLNERVAYCGYVWKQGVKAGDHGRASRGRWQCTKCGKPMCPECMAHIFGRR